MNRIVQKIMILLLLTFTANALLAQQSTSQEQLKRQMNRLNEKIREARRFAGLFPNRQLNEIVQSAEKQLTQAQEAFRSRKYQVASAHVKMGFSILNKLYQQLRNNSFVRTKFKDKLDQKISQAEQVVTVSQNAEARKLLNRARFFRQRAFRLSAADQSESALKNYFLAIFFAESAIKTVKGSESEATKSLEKQFEESETLLEQAKEVSTQGKTSSIKDLLQKAERELRNARRLYGARQPFQAYQKLQIANRLLFRILDLIEKKSGARNGRLFSDLQMLEENLTEFRPTIEQANQADLKRLFERLTFLSAAIRQNYNSHNFLKARQQLSVANRLLLQLNRRLNKTGSSVDSQIETQLETAGVMFQSLDQSIGKNPDLKPLVDLLQKNLEEARIARRNNNQPVAVHHLKIFNQLALKLDQIRTARQTEEKSKSKIEENLQRVKELLENPPANLESDAVLNLKYDNAKKLYDYARNACAAKRYVICWQVTQLALNLLTQ